MMRLSRAVVLAGLALLILSACAAPTPTPNPMRFEEGGMTTITTPDGREVRFLTVSGATRTNDSQPITTYGTLTEENGCLLLTTRAERFLTVWPPGYTLNATAETLEVVDHLGQVVARTGERYAFDGGALRSTNDANTLTDPDDVLPLEGCPGIYWIGTAVSPLEEVRTEAKQALEAQELCPTRETLIARPVNTTLIDRTYTTRVERFTLADLVVVGEVIALPEGDSNWRDVVIEVGFRMVNEVRDEGETVTLVTNNVSAPEFTLAVGEQVIAFAQLRDIGQPGERTNPVYQLMGWDESYYAQGADGLYYHAYEAAPLSLGEMEMLVEACRENPPGAEE